MTTPFSFEGTLTAPEGRELHGEPIPFLAKGVFDSKISHVFDLPLTPGTLPVDFGTIPTAGAKLIAMKYESRPGAAPVRLQINGGTNTIELSSGGCISYFSPTPDVGITSLSITHTTSGRIRVWVLG